MTLHEVFRYTVGNRNVPPTPFVKNTGLVLAEQKSAIMELT